MKSGARLLLPFILVLSVDVLTKLWAEQALLMNQSISVFGELLQFTLGFNSGIAFGLFANSAAVPLLTASILVGMLSFILWQLYRSNFSKEEFIPFGFILGGATGNVVDRLIDLKVTDFIDLGVGTLRWYTFNMADVFIVLGVLQLLIITLRREYKIAN